MKSSRVLTLAAVFLLAVALLAGNPLLAKSVKISVDFYEISCAVDPGIEWTSGNTHHIRGAMSSSIFYDPVTFAEVGTDAVVANANINLKTGRQNFFGTFSLIYSPVSPTGTFDGSWNAKLDAGTGTFLGRAVGHGTADQAGKKMKLVLASVADLPPEILAILAAPPWTDCPMITGVLRATGFIHDPKGG